MIGAASWRLWTIKPKPLILIMVHWRTSAVLHTVLFTSTTGVFNNPLGAEQDALMALIGDAESMSARTVCQVPARSRI